MKITLTTQQAKSLFYVHPDGYYYPLAVPRDEFHEWIKAIPNDAVHWSNPGLPHWIYFHNEVDGMQFKLQLL